MDTVDKITRTKIMSSVKQKDTGPEMKLRTSLFKLGYRYRLYDKSLPGSPDIVMKKYNAVIFIHGCFWHRHGCKFSTTPSTNIEFWQKKFKANIARDKKKIEFLIKKNWRVMVIWECTLKTKIQNNIAECVEVWLVSNKQLEEMWPVN